MNRLEPVSISHLDLSPSCAFTSNEHPKRITFVLPVSGHEPVGGFKVVYEYANGLVQRGHHVSIVHPVGISEDMPVTTRAKKYLRYWQRAIDKSYRPDRWFKLLPEVDLRWVPTLDPKYIPDADAIVATAWQTAEWVARYPDDKGAKLYLIQHLETWCGPEERVKATWKLPLRKIVISRWLGDFAAQLHEETDYVPNGLDFSAFGMDKPQDQRDPYLAMMLYHEADWKGSQDGLGAFRLVKKSVPDLRVILFGLPEKPSGLEPWFTYYRNPAQSVLRSLYNEASVFVTPSWAEGWPLPPAEAMMSGTMLVATDIGGHREYATHERTGLLSPPHDVEALASNIVRVMQNTSLRKQLAQAGYEHIQHFTWDKAVDAFEGIVLRETEKACNP